MKIDITHLRKAFGEKVAVDIDEYHIGDGEMIGLVGNNGAGKTTLFRLMLDLLKADEGTVEFAFAAENGSEMPVEHRVNPAESEEWKEHTGAYVDDGFLIDFLTPEEFFDFVGKVCGINKQEVEARVKTFEHLMAGEILEQKPSSRASSRSEISQTATGVFLPGQGSIVAQPLKRSCQPFKAPVPTTFASGHRWANACRCRLLP